MTGKSEFRKNNIWDLIEALSTDSDEPLEVRKDAVQEIRDYCDVVLGDLHMEGSAQ